MSKIVRYQTNTKLRWEGDHLAPGESFRLLYGSSKSLLDTLASAVRHDEGEIFTSDEKELFIRPWKTDEAVAKRGLKLVWLLGAEGRHDAVMWVEKTSEESRDIEIIFRSLSRKIEKHPGAVVWAANRVRTLFGSSTELGVQSEKHTRLDVRPLNLAEAVKNRRS